MSDKAKRKRRIRINLILLTLTDSMFIYLSGLIDVIYAEKTIFSTPSPKFQFLIISSLLSLSRMTISVNPESKSIFSSSSTGTDPVIQPL